MYILCHCGWLSHGFYTLSSIRIDDGQPEWSESSPEVWPLLKRVSFSGLCPMHGINTKCCLKCFVIFRSHWKQKVMQILCSSEVCHFTRPWQLRNTLGTNTPKASFTRRFVNAIPVADSWIQFSSVRDSGSRFMQHSWFGECHLRAL